MLGRSRRQIREAVAGGDPTPPLRRCHTCQIPSTFVIASDRQAVRVGNALLVVDGTD